MDVIYRVCPACQYIEYDIPRSSDAAHDNLCCGTIGPCSDPYCMTHAEYESMGPVVNPDGSPTAYTLSMFGHAEDSHNEWEGGI